MQTEREAEALLRAVGERYAGLPSYRDHGCVRWQNEGLMDALAGPTGVSLGAAHTIPALLLPEASKGSWSLLQLNGVRLIARPANLEVARDLIWVGGTGWAGQVLRVAVDPETLLIWRLEDDGLGEHRPYHTEYEPDATGSVLPEEVLGEDRGRV